MLWSIASNNWNLQKVPHNRSDKAIEAIDSDLERQSLRDSEDSTNSRSRNWQGPWPRTPGRVVGTSFIRLYQLTLSGFVGNACRHQPTCSEYGYEAIARHGLLKGSWLTLKRVVRCGPFGSSGFDPVPGNQSSKNGGSNQSV